MEEVKQIDVVFSCCGCGINIIRDSEEHDFCHVDPDDEDRWFCGDCKCENDEESDDDMDKSCCNKNCNGGRAFNLKGKLFCSPCCGNAYWGLTHDDEDYWSEEDWSEDFWIEK